MSDLMLMYEYLNDLYWGSLDADNEVDAAHHFQYLWLKDYYLREIRRMAE